jgi:lambda family phage minor tail protein L
MTTAASESQKLTQDIKVRLLEITHSTGGTLRFTNSIRDDDTSVVFGGDTFVGRKFLLRGFEVKTAGTLPRPALKLDNTDSFWYSLLVNNDFFAGADVNYREVYRDNLDDGGDPDTTQIILELNYVIFQMKRLHREEVEFHLRTPLDTEQVDFGRQLLRNTCARRYRVPDPNNTDTFFQENCPWGDQAKRPGTGTPFFKKDGTTTSDWREDSCGQLYEDCRRRFHNADNSVKLPFWGAPSIGSK